MSYILPKQNTMRHKKHHLPDTILPELFFITITRFELFELFLFEKAPDT